MHTKHSRLVLNLCLCMLMYGIMIAFLALVNTWIFLQSIICLFVREDGRERERDRKRGREGERKREDRNKERGGGGWWIGRRKSV